MILTCPNCGTQYVVKDGAIPPNGRQVRCASCKNSWHQDPEEMPEAEAAAPVEAEEETIAEAALIEPRSGPEAEERAYQEAMVEEEAISAPEPVAEEHFETFPETAPTQGPAVPAEEEGAILQPDWREPPQPEVQDDDFGPFPEREDEVEPRRRSRFVGLLLIVAVVAAVAAAFWFLAPPEWKARVGLTGSGESPLALVTTHMDRQRLESGNELLTVTGRVINPTDRDQQVPPLRAELRSSTGQLVHSWTIAPPARSLPPGASASFNSAEVNVPPGGDELTITLGPPRA
jgi:predicted Zn finger-like uncharacterized protein